MNPYVREATAVLGIALLGLAACGGRGATVTASSGAAERRPADAAVASVMPAAVVVPPASGGTGCDAPEVEDVPTPDEATTRQLLIGSWLLCDSPSFFGTTNENGLVIAADDHWAKLASVSAGTRSGDDWSRQPRHVGVDRHEPHERAGPLPDQLHRP